MKKYKLVDNVISIVVGLLIATTVGLGAYKSQNVEATSIKTYSGATIELETLVSSVESTTEVIEEIEPIETVEETEAITEPVINYINLGEFRITAYCACERCCGSWANNRPDGIVYGASGNELIPNYSIAVDPEVIPYGAVVYIDGNPYVAHDCGGAIKDNRIDVYFDSHEDALAWGVQYKDVYVEEIN